MLQHFWREKMRQYFWREKMRQQFWREKGSNIFWRENLYVFKKCRHLNDIYLQQVN
jgi:hypothetical protein